MSRITVIDIQHKSFKKSIQGYDRADVDAFLDEVIETIEDDATARAALEAEIADLRERISHFKSMEESLQHTLVLAQRTADEVKAAAHKEADLIRAEARMIAEREIASLGDRIAEARREYQRAVDTANAAKSEIRSLLHSHLALLDRVPYGAQSVAPPVAAATPVAAAQTTVSAVQPEPEASAAVDDEPSLIDDETQTGPVLFRNGIAHTLVN